MSLYFDKDEAITLLQGLGYRVSKVDFSEVEAITSVKALVEHFYACRRYYNAEREYPLSIDYKEDTKKVASFVKSREKLGLNRKEAIKEAALLIDVMFKFEECFFLKEPIMSLGILGVRPFMDKVCSISNGEVDSANQFDNDLSAKEFNEFYNKKFGDRDFERASEERKQMLRRLHGEDGK